jgi:hypothetical protein
LGREWRKYRHAITRAYASIHEVSTTLHDERLKFTPGRRDFFFGVKDCDRIGGFLGSATHRNIEICTTTGLTASCWRT